MRFALLAVAVLLAGCSSPEGEGPSIQGAVDAVLGEEIDPAKVPGAIQGVVTDPALAPIGSATILLVREERVTVSDASGLFVFADLAPGSYLVQASAAGYATRTVSTQARNGTLTTLNLTLDPDLTPNPHPETLEMRGFLSCGAQVEGPLGEQGADCAAADPNHKDLIEFQVNDLGKNVVLELVWDTAKDPATKRLNLHVETVGYGALDEDLGNVTGEGYVRLVVPQEVMEKYYPEGGMIRARITMDPDEGAPAVAAFQTAFTLYATIFYVEPGPADHSVLGG